MLRVGDKLEAAAILPWLDTVHVQPGLPVRTMPEELIETIAATAACGGKQAIEQGQARPISAFIDQCVRAMPVGDSSAAW